MLTTPAMVTGTASAPLIIDLDEEIEEAAGDDQWVQFRNRSFEATHGSADHLHREVPSVASELLPEEPPRGDHLLPSLVS